MVEFAGQVVSRHMRHVVAVVLACAVIGAVTPGVAGADAIADKRAQAASVARQIDALNRRIDQLSERYDAARLRVRDVNAKLSAATAAAARAEQGALDTRARLRSIAVDAYVHGGSTNALGTFLAQRDAGDLGVAQQYLDAASGYQTTVLDSLRAAGEDERARQAELGVVRNDEAAASAALGRARTAAQQAVGQQTATLAKVKGELAILVAAEQRRQALALAARTRAFLAQQARAAAVAAARARAAADLTTGPLPPPNGRGAVAVAAAQRQLGKPYEWGAAGPDSFDCSGLTMWAWRAAGVSLDHYSGSQYAETTHIPLSDLAPGDLVFFFGDLSHVGIYVGNGTMIHAPHTGDVVRYASIYEIGTPIYAGRVNG